MSDFNKRLAEALAAQRKREQEMKIEILPCPFCGGEPCLTEHTAYAYGSTCGIYCMNCGAQSGQFFLDVHDAFAAWNRRTNYGVSPGKKYEIIGLRPVSSGDKTDAKNENMD